MKGVLRKAARALGYDIVRFDKQTGGFPRDATAEDRAILQQVAPYTMTSIERQLALVSAARHIVRSGIAGCFVECGVWRGGSAMAAALAFAQEGDVRRDLHLFDTYEGMSPPTDADREADGTAAATLLAQQKQGTGVWCYADLNDVQTNMGSTGYPSDRVHFIRGPVEETIPARAPAGPIALLRLDTDWYESTRHELVNLFPLLTEGGVLIVDDYGHWQGARKAVDEYFKGQEKVPFLHRIDYTGRLLVKHAKPSGAA